MVSHFIFKYLQGRCTFNEIRFIGLGYRKRWTGHDRRFLTRLMMSTTTDEIDTYLHMSHM